MILKLKDGDIKIELFEDVAPNHVKRIKQIMFICTFGCSNNDFIKQF